MKKIIILVVIILILAGLYKYISYQPIAQVTDDNADLIIYWGEGCSHCEKVKEYISTNKLDQKIKISLKEVYHNQENLQSLEDTVKKCPEVDIQQGIGVPLAFDTKNQKCLSGDQPIIDWFVAR
jgi:glutaredoxin